MKSGIRMERARPSSGTFAHSKGTEYPESIFGSRSMPAMLRRRSRSRLPNSVPGDERVRRVMTPAGIHSGTVTITASRYLLATTLAKTSGMYGKAVKSRHCPATVCAFAASPSFSIGGYAALDCHEPPTGFSESGKGTGRRRSYSPARESGDRSRCALHEPRSEGNEGEP
jgi:hypothetical protein